MEVKPLGLDDALNGSAQNWSAHLAATRSFEHSDDSALRRLNLAMFKETIWRGSRWQHLIEKLDSLPDFRTYVADPRYEQLGVGLTVDEEGLINLVMQFGRKL